MVAADFRIAVGIAASIAKPAPFAGLIAGAQIIGQSLHLFAVSRAINCRCLEAHTIDFVVLAPLLGGNAGDGAAWRGSCTKGLHMHEI